MARAKATNDEKGDITFADDKAQPEGYSLNAMSGGGRRRSSSSKRDLDADFKDADTQAIEGVASSSRGNADDDAGTVEDGSIADRPGDEYKVYKRRWFGLAALTFLNIIVSWDVSSHSVHGDWRVSCCSTSLPWFHPALCTLLAEIMMQTRNKTMICGPTPTSSLKITRTLSTVLTKPCPSGSPSRLSRNSLRPIMASANRPLIGSRRASYLCLWP